jgi:Leucine-rich repeat (LRR) protein
MKHLNLLFLMSLACAVLIYGMEEKTSSFSSSFRARARASGSEKMLKQIEGNSPADRIKCTILDVSHQKIEYLNLEKLLNMFPNLKTLKAVGCEITKIDPIVTPDDGLTYIDLSGNNLKKWQMSFVAKAKALKKLNLSNNSILEIDLQDALEGLSLDLENNYLSLVELHKIKRGKPLAFLNLSGNNLSYKAYTQMLPYVPAGKKDELFYKRIVNLIIAGAAGTVTTLGALAYSQKEEQIDRNYYGTAGTEERDEADIWSRTAASFFAGAFVAGLTYKKLNDADRKIYALQHEQWVKKIDLRNQQSGLKLIEEEDKSN